uniref:Uncharacterized protein n=1 Tax=Zea mays TaxID=4577 RepID=C4J5N2_MAIZE|nr:unknown [Zea mays]
MLRSSGIRVSHSLVVLEPLVYGIRFEEEWLPRVPTNLTAPAAGYATSFNGQVLPFPSVSLYIFGVARVTNSHIRGDITSRSAASHASWSCSISQPASLRSPSIWRRLRPRRSWSGSASRPRWPSAARTKLGGKAATRRPASSSRSAAGSRTSPATSSSST